MEGVMSRKGEGVGVERGKKEGRSSTREVERGKEFSINLELCPVSISKIMPTVTCFCSCT